MKTYEDYQAEKLENGAYIRNYGKTRCKHCHCFNCVCQTTLDEFKINGGN